MTHPLIHQQLSPSSWRYDTGLFLLFALTSVLAMVTVLGALTIGVFVLPLAATSTALTFWLANRRSRWGHAWAGVLIAPAFAVAIVATWINAVREPSKLYCSADGTCKSAGLDRPESWSVPLMVTAALIALAAVAVFIGVGRHLKARAR